ncbi:helix-turn-helix domain-containing protein [Herbidospora daliensis]|uniref:helix-turn-helix domain-containing protein n=1 Tax=Herbidospora daliensis TaxID=295585 RepID=UPI00078429A0|nr:helix-turn-helix domain-containing protein [Herbidospora daliensis]
MEITVTTREAASAAGVSIRTIQRRAKAGKLNATKRDGRWVITLNVADDYKPAQIEKARELLEQNGLSTTGKPGIWVAISSDGETYYSVTPEGCGCYAGLKGTRCYHRLGAQVGAAIAA